MKKILILLFILCILAIPVLGSYANIRSWYPYGNHPNLTANYQTGSQSTYPLNDSISISYNTNLYPAIFDPNGDGKYIYPVFYTGYIRTYHAHNLTYIDELATSLSKPITYDVGDFNGDGKLEFMTIATLSTNGSKQFFNVYNFSSTLVPVLEKNFQLDLDYPVNGHLKCGVDFDADGSKDCLYVAVNSSGSSYLIGYDSSSTDAANPSIKISLGGTYSHNNAYYDQPQFLDGNRDGQLDALVNGIYPSGSPSAYIFIVNQTATKTLITLSAPTTGYMDAIARWYNKDAGDYEFLVMSRIPAYVPGDGTTRSGIRVQLYGYDGTLIWTTPNSLSCPSTAISGGGTAGGCQLFSGYPFDMSLAYTNINNGKIYVYGSCRQSSVASMICTYDKDGTNLSRKSVTPTAASYVYGNRYWATSGSAIVWADMTDGGDLEAVHSRAIVDLNGDVKYSPMGTPDIGGWCVPVDLNQDTKLELFCSMDGQNTSIFGVSLALDSTPPTFSQFTINSTDVKVNDALLMSAVISEPLPGYYVFSTNFSGSWQNDTGGAVYYIDGQNVSYIKQVTQAGYQCFAVWANDTLGNSNTSDPYCFMAANPDITAPVFSGYSTNSSTIKVNDWIKMGVTINETNPGYYIFSTNLTGAYLNESAASYTDDETVYLSKQVTLSGKQCFKVYANDSWGNSATSSTYCFTTSSGGGGGGGAWPEEEIIQEPPPEQLLVIPAEEESLLNLDFSGFYDDFKVLFQKVFTGEVKLTDVSDKAQTYWLELLITAGGLTLAIFAGRTAIKGKKRRK